jgi:hypothetical protein
MLMRAEELKTDRGVSAKRIYARSELLGLGFSKVHRKRRPLRWHLTPGSVIMLSGKDLKKTWIGDLTDYGFGSILGVM